VTITALFAEILIVGLETAAWVLLLILTIFGKDWVHPSELRGWDGLITVLVLASAYVLGILMDRVANRILGWLPVEEQEPPQPGRTVGAAAGPQTGAANQGGGAGFDGSADTQLRSAGRRCE
jgi:hypothetical protein